MSKDLLPCFSVHVSTHPRPRLICSQRGRGVGGGVYSSKCLYAHDPPRSRTARYPHSRSFPERDIRFERTKNGVLQAKTNLGRRRKIGLFLRTGYHFEGKFHHLTEFKFSGERARTFMIPMAAGIGRTQLKKK